MKRVMYLLFLALAVSAVSPYMVMAEHEAGYPPILQGRKPNTSALCPSESGIYPPLPCEFFGNKDGSIYKLILAPDGTSLWVFKTNPDSEDEVIWENPKFKEKEKEKKDNEPKVEPKAKPEKTKALPPDGA